MNCLLPSQLHEAQDFAWAAHKGQFRSDGVTPYIEHPIAVAKILLDAGLDVRSYADFDVLRAALLHDVLEDTDVTVKAIEQSFGPTVAFLVGYLTQGPIPKGVGRLEHQIEFYTRAPASVQRVKLADKLANIRDLAKSCWTAQRKSHYLDTGVRLATALRPVLPSVADEIIACRQHC